MPSTPNSAELKAKQESSKKRVKGRYVKEDLLGEGSYGKVYKVKDTKNDQMLALKVANSDWMDDTEDRLPDWIIRETATLRELIHPNIIR